MVYNIFGFGAWAHDKDRKDVQEAQTIRTSNCVILKWYNKPGLPVEHIF